MRRFTIARLMILVAILGANFGAVRFLNSPSSDTIVETRKTLLSGLLPLADALILALCMVASRYRVSLRSKTGSRKGGVAPAFAACCGLLLLVSIVLCLLGTMEMWDYLEWAAAPVERLAQSFGTSIDREPTLLRYVLLPTFLGVVLSGPPLIVASALALLLSRFTLVVTPRVNMEDAPCDGSASLP